LPPVVVSGEPARAERDVEAQRPRRDDPDLGPGLLGAEAHDRPLAELLFDLAEHRSDRLVFFHVEQLNRYL
jgi:hypothetical protein